MFTSLNPAALLPARGWGLLVCGFVVGCGGDLPALPAEPTPDALSVNFLLQHGGTPPEFQDPQGQKTPAERVYGFIGRVSDPARKPMSAVYDASASINGVPLRVRRAGGWYDGTSRPLESEYNYYSDSLAVRPGAEYTLVVEHGGERLVSTTRVPGEFRLTGLNGSPDGATLRRGEPLVIAWTRAEGAPLYAVTVRSTPDPGLIEVTTRHPFMTADTTATLDLTASRAGPIPVVVEIRAMDANLYRASAFRDPRAGIENGYGFVGSANVVRHRATLHVNEPSQEDP
ncbi:MAG TPA: hypothetical protein VGB92_01185 [Longimicrobium sp.]|jgi:hypothetical protein